MPENKYESIAQYIENEIKNKKLKPGCKAPSIRELCSIFSCSKSSVLRAYNELQMKRMLYSKPKSGYYVIKDNNDNNGTDREIYDYASANIDKEVLPYGKLHTCINKAMEIYGETLFQYCNTQGFEPLRSAIRQYLSDYQVFADTSKIFITSGSQQALNILSNMEFPNRKKNILVEQPTYLCMLDILNTYKLTTLGIERDYGNLDIKRLEYLFRTGDIKFFYTMPRFHHPTGTSFTNDQKKAIASLAEKYDVYIVEDDQLADLEMDSRADPLYAFDTSSHVVYIRSFSKALLPGIRLAAIVLPDSLAREFKKYKYLNDVFTSPLLQAALEIFIKSGMHHDHINKIKQFYSHKMNFFKKSWNALGLKIVNSNIPDTGFYSWFELPDNIKGDFVKHNLQSKNIYIDSGARYYINDFRKDNTIKICINNVSIDKMKSSLPVIGSEINRLIALKSADSFFIMI